MRKSVTPERTWMTTEEVAARFRTAPGTVRYWRFNGTGPTGVRFGRRVLYDLVEVERWEAERTHPLAG
ncbi:helix-turn-helix domain-containing protein [Actinoplanes sp. NPDC026670]|uniref:helix-turn-helix transcriptional regulator n=1 Tax=Actinoplanes sp. NPDC026670 TaxID=3154700 RepID=UPI0033FDE387